MSRFEKRALLGLGLLIVLLAVLEAMAPSPTDWSPSYSRYHRKPYGAQLVYESLTDLFPKVSTERDPISTTAAARIGEADIAYEPVNHVFINSRMDLGELDAEYLLELVSAGDNVFIAAEGFSNVLADTLNISCDQKYWYGNDTSDIRFIGDKRIAQGVFRFSRNFPGAYFTSYDTSRTRVLAVDGSSNPVLIETQWGDGTFVLCSAPRALTYYNLVKDRNHTFMAGAFSVLPPLPVLWDEYYKVGRSESSTPMRYLLSQPALRYAWFIALAVLLLYIFVYARRHQRAIPVVVPPRNATRHLADTIGRLYWHKADHADLARKMVMLFKDEVRARTYLRVFNYDESTIAHLATKTGRAKEEIAERLNAFHRREQATRINEKDLLDLSNELYEFRQLIR